MKWKHSNKRSNKQSNVGPSSLNACTPTAGDTLLIKGNYLGTTPAPCVPNACCLFDLLLPMMHCVFLRFLLLVYNLVHFAFTPQTNQGSLGNEPRPLFPSRPEFACLVDERHTTQNIPDYLRTQIRVRLKWTKQLWSEGDLRMLPLRNS